MTESSKRIKNGGFSLIELVIVIAVLAILSILSGPYFLRLINLARFESAKNHMRDSFISCINDPNISPSNPYIPGVAFQSSNCSSLITATIDNSCTISMDMSNGAKTGWTDSFENCISTNNLAENNQSNSEESNSNNNDLGVSVSYPSEIDSIDHCVMTSDPNSSNGSKVFCGADGFHASEKAYNWHCKESSGNGEHKDHHEGVCNRAKESFGCEWDSSASNFKLSAESKTCAEKINDWDCQQDWEALNGAGATGSQFRRCGGDDGEYKDPRWKT